MVLIRHLSVAIPVRLQEEMMSIFYHIMDLPSVYKCLSLPKGKKYKIEIIDTWDMTIPL